MYKQCNINHKKKEILPFATTWMDLEDIMLSEIIQRQILFHLYVESKRTKQMNRHKKKNKVRYTKNNQVVSRWKGVWEGEKKVKEVKRCKVSVIK